MKACVTGAAGFIGSHLCDRLLAMGCEVVGVDNYSTGRNERDFIHDRDIKFYGLYDLMLGCDVVYHLAANADVRHGLDDPMVDIQENIVATYRVLECAQQAGVKKVMLASTGSVYGDTKIYPTPEDAPMPIQTSIYATSKIAAEGLLTSYAQAYDMQVYIFRFAGVLGPRYTHGHVIDFYRKLKENPNEITILGNGFAEKSYIDINDLAAGIVCGMAADKKVNIFNVGIEDYVTVKESLKIICREMSADPLIHCGEGTGWPGDNFRIIPDTQRLRRMGWYPKRTIEQSLVRTVNYLKEVEP
jgi:UDP-glucose 4-epimerase